MNKLISFLVLLSCVLGFVSFAADYPQFYSEEIVVTALKLPVKKADTPWETEVITRKKIDNSTPIVLGDILRDIPGMTIKANGGLSSQISAMIRGTTAQQTLVLLNGSRINTPTLGQFDLSSILLADVERVEVVKAPLSAIYGADAVGGCINIITRRPAPANKFDFTAEYGSYSTLNLALAGSGPHYSLSANSIGSAGFVQDNNYKTNDFNLRLNGGLGKADLELGVLGHFDERKIANAYNVSQINDNNNYFDLKCNFAEAGVKATLSQAAQNMKDVESWSQDTHNTLTTIFDLQKSFEGFSGQTLVLGFENRNDSGNSTQSGVNNLDNRAGYVQDSLRLSESTSLVIGARLDVNSVYGTNINPRIGCVINPFPDMSVKLSWGTSYRAPTINDLYWNKSTYPTFTGGVGTTEGNPNVRPETAQSIDVTLERAFGPQALIKMSVFGNVIKDLIEWSNTSSSAIDEYWTPSNVSNANIFGMELAGQKNFLEGLDGSLNLTLLSAKDANSGKFLNYRPTEQANASLIYSNPSAINANLLVKQVGERYSDAANTSKLAGYTVVDLTLVKQVLQWKIKFDIDNLLNASYEETALYPMPGRRYNISVCRTL